MLNARLIVSLLAGSIGFAFPMLTPAEDRTLIPSNGLHPVFIGQPMRPEDEGRWVETEGTVTFVGKREKDLNLELSSESGRMLVSVANVPDVLSALLLKSRVRIGGTCAGIHSEVDGTIIGSIASVQPTNIFILQASEETWQRYPLQSISDATHATTPADAAIVHLRGQMVEAGTPALQDASGRIAVSAATDFGRALTGDIEMLGAIEADGGRAVFRCQVVRPILPENGASPVLPTLTTIEQIHWLKPEEAARQYPVKVRGTVTWVQPGLRNGSVQDGTGGVYVRNLDVRGPQLKRGNFCEIEGVTIPGGFAPGIECHKLTVLGVGEYPEPMRPTWEEINSGRLDVQWVEVQGVVIAITNQSMQIFMKGGRLNCTTPPIRNVDRYLNTVVGVRGVVVYHADSSRNFHGEHLDVPAEEFISVEEPATRQSDLQLIHGTADLMRYNPGEMPFRQVKVVGQVVHVRNGIIYLSDNTNGFRVIPAAQSPSLLPVGTVVEAVGFPQIDNPESPILTVREAAIRSLGQKPLPAPQNIQADDLFNPAHDSTRVRLEAQLVNIARYKNEEVLELQTGPGIYRAPLDVDELHAVRVPVGSRLEVCGVYVVDTFSHRRADSFELLLNSAADIRVLQRPSWWTGAHAAMVVGVMALLLMLGLFWVVVLQQQVAKRTAQWSNANQSLRREMAERRRAEDELVGVRAEQMVEQERNRIARDLHDDLGSRVTRVVLMLDELALEDRVTKSDDPLRRISVAAQEIIRSLDENVWLVNARNDTLPHLIDYIGHFATDFLRAANIRCRMDFPDDPPELALSSEVRHNLFLAVKEALTNAVRHAQATEIRLGAVIDREGTLTLTVEDDGRGFEADAGQPSADGLKNMRQRMEAVGGRFHLESDPNRGTKVTLVHFCSGRK